MKDAPLFLVDRTLPSLNDNLALDEALLLQAEAGAGEEVLRFWEYPKLAVVLGAGGQIAIDVDDEACARDDIQLARRTSGGGTVLLGQGCLQYSLVLRFDRAPELRDVTASYRWIMGRIKNRLRALDSNIEISGSSDLSIAGRKFSGNAQQRKRTHLLHHGTLLYDFDLAAIPRYLRMPEKQPDYRQSRPHLEFIRNLSATAATLRKLLSEEWEAEREMPLPLERMQALLEEKYLLDTWVRRR